MAGDGWILAVYREAVTIGAVRMMPKVARGYFT